MREAWIRARGDVRTDGEGKFCASDLAHPPTQREYALRGIITPAIAYGADTAYVVLAVEGTVCSVVEFTARR